MSSPRRFVHLNNTNMTQIIYAYEDESGADVVASLDFWTKAQSADEAGADATYRRSRMVSMPANGHI